MNIDWNQRATDTKSKEKSAQESVRAWLACNPDWDGEIFFMNYPPRLVAKFEIVHINMLSDKRLIQVGDLITKLCNDLEMNGFRYWFRNSNKVEYKLWVPFK